ncbi:MAG: histidine phosphatase family protein [Planctomycetaceae bacterium]
MKTLLLLRHAKSSWKDSELPDHDRPLKPRGIKAARRIGRLLREQNLIPERILCSTATRARETLRLAEEEFPQKSATEFIAALYHCAPREFVTALHNVEDNVHSVMIVGHNPGMEEWLQSLIGQPGVMPTGCLVQMALPVDNWSQVTESTRSELINIWRPRELMD